jgi:phosphate transport system substrate-binding protein
VTQALQTLACSFTWIVKIPRTKFIDRSTLVIARVLKFAGLAVAGAVMAATPSLAQDLTGAGATFPQPLYAKWFDMYAKSTGVKINYQGIGSGGGIKQLTEQTVDFGASDAPMSDEELSKMKSPVLHIPTVLGAVVITYNLPGVAKPLNLTGPVIADIFLGRITKWNAPEIAALNKGVTLPAKDILVVHRSEGSGTTYIFTEYLTGVSRAWATGPGRGKEVNWPIGLGGRGNDGVTGQIRQLPGAIGYVELNYARQNKLPQSLIQNASGKFIAPTIESVTAAAAHATAKLSPTSDLRLSIVNAAGADAYPISAFTYILVYQNQHDATKSKKLTDFLKWAIHDGELVAPTLDYSPLPKSIVSMLDKRLATVKVVASK